MEVGPTCHYVMGGVEVDPDTGAALIPGLFAAGEVSGGMHGSNRLGGNSLSDLLVFGRRAGLGASEHASEVTVSVPESEVEAALAEALAPYDRDGGENPYAVHQELQQTMNDLVGIIRREEELEQAIEALGKLRERVANVAVEGGRGYHPGWHLALDLRNMVLVSECVAKAALERQESRGGHTRDDYPVMSPEWRKVNLVCRSAADRSGGFVELKRQEMDPMR
jgi:succinate dehydrogenase / fumarate reductase, flavoprotein subunit